MAKDINPKDLKMARYKAAHALGCAITEVIMSQPPYLGYEDAMYLYREWREEEDGQIAIDRLVTLIIH